MFNTIFQPRSDFRFQMQLHQRSVEYLTPGCSRLFILKEFQRKDGPKRLSGSFIQQELFKYLLSKQTEKAMAPHSSTLAWKIPWMEEPGGLQSMGLLRAGHN